MCEKDANEGMSKGGSKGGRDANEGMSTYQSAAHCKEGEEGLRMSYRALSPSLGDQEFLMQLQRIEGVGIGEAGEGKEGGGQEKCCYSFLNFKLLNLDILLAQLHMNDIQHKYK